MKNIFFNAHHSPIGAFASLTLGYRGAKGGLGLELKQPADRNIYIGIQSRDSNCYKALPFFAGGQDDSKRYDVERVDDEIVQNEFFTPFHENEIIREFNVCTDRWIAEDLDVKIYSQVCSIPDPQKASAEELKSVLIPAVLVEMTIDNTKGKSIRRAFIGYDETDPYYSMRHINDDKQGIVGIAQGGLTAIIADSGIAYPAVNFSPECILGETLKENWNFGLGNTALLIMEAPAGETTTYRFAVCFFREGQAVLGEKTKYYYTKFFENLEQVGRYSLDKFDIIKNKCLNTDDYYRKTTLSEDQRFMMAHAIRSYYGCTEMLEKDGKPLWIINEGEYRMLNTLDLTVDQLFFELKMNPWTVRNVLDFFLEKYSYHDKVCFPGDSTEYEGGITFTHDMGVGNVFSRPGHSAYEKSGIDGCFSYMSHEQLVNWLCCALVYIENTKDEKWLKDNIDVIKECFESMMNRDNPDPNKRNGIMGLDSNCTRGGAEITTYDSLDVSLGQARNNIYLAGKCWGVYVSLSKLFKRLGIDNLACTAEKQAILCADTILSYVTADGYIPAILGENNDSKIIPAIEGLVFPYFTGCKEALDLNGKYSIYLKALKKHLEVILVKGTCIFEDGGWKLSSTSTNSWLSKIYLCQFVARKILGETADIYSTIPDQAHVQWLTHPEHSYWSWSDQIISGVITGSKYYPRGVTNTLWLLEQI